MQTRASFQDICLCLTGLIGWVPNTDTLHALIREYRDARKIPLNVEHRLMLGMAPDYDNLTVIQKVEVFEHALDSTSGTPEPLVNPYILIISPDNVIFTVIYAVLHL